MRRQKFGRFQMVHGPLHDQSSRFPQQGLEVGFEQVDAQSVGELAAVIAEPVQSRSDGTLVLVRPETDAATAWLNENVDECVWFAGALVVEPRYVEGLLLGMADEGFMVRAGA
ncbi:MAG: hypothetical protein IH921_13195 [Gemmatimonadetes bacterium]|nr:hypothetical protein [Gemmatimonadota bacterium]